MYTKLISFKKILLDFFPFLKRDQAHLGVKLQGKHFVLGFVFVLSLTFFLHYTEVRVEHLELGQVAKKSILTPISFSFPDIEATSLLKQEAIRDVGLIRRLDWEQIVQIDREIENELKTYPNWRDKIPKATFDDVYKCKELIRENLRKIHFVDERTYQKMKDLKLPSEGFIIFTKDNSQEGFLPASTWEEIHAMNASKFVYSDPVYQYMSDMFSQKLWHFQEDLSTQNRIRQEVKMSVPQRKTQAETGSWVIQKGEKVTQRHVDMMNAMKKEMMEKDNLITPLSIAGSFVMAVIFTTLIILYLRMQNLDVLCSFRKLALMATIIVLSLILAKLTEFIILNKSGSFVDAFCYPIVILFGALLSCLLLDIQISFIVSIFLSIVLCITLAVKHDYFLVMNLGASLVGIISVRKIRTRKEIFEVCAKVWLAVIPIIIAFSFIQNHFLNFQLIKELFAAFIFIGVTAVIVVALLPVLEAVFHVTTGMTLTEYIDPNHPLLRKLSMEAPGTYQHSCIVGTIAEALALTIGANGLFCRVVALFHDVGKLSNPQYFTENQINHFNLHQLITPIESAQVIKAHVSDGVSIAKQYGLPQPVIDVIEEHHGTSVVHYFYHQQLEQVGDPGLVDMNYFRYPGPKPRSKESAIIMVSDCVEAAFSSLDVVDEAILNNLIEKIIGEKIQDGQLDECKLTFEELKKIKKTILKTLLVISHTRLKYTASNWKLNRDPNPTNPLPV